MGTLLSLGIVAALLYGVRRCLRAPDAGTAAERREYAAERAERRRIEAASARRQQERALETRRQNALARRFQVALLQVGQSPDFRRAASCALQARSVPAAFRQRQFQRFRPQLVRHFAARLEAGVDAEELAATLTQLVQALGLAAFEADYIRAEVESARREPTRREPSYAQQLDGLRRQHEDRLAALRSLPGVDDDTREQLIEAEATRFREELLRLGQVAQPPT